MSSPIPWLNPYDRRMSSDPADLVAEGNRALADGDWPAARDAFKAALEDVETAEALAGYGNALWWLGDAGAAVDCLERAYAAFRRQQDPASAAATAVRLAVHHWASLGNVAASSGWVSRAARLVEDYGLEPLRGWVLLLEAYGERDSKRAETLARQAQEQARGWGDLDLELCALSQIGAAVIDQGRISEGVRYLDEAMAGSLSGEGGSPDTAVFTSCNTIIACTTCAEFERVVQWIRAADRFTKRFGCPFLYAECRTLYGDVLVATGDWLQAEEELAGAIEMTRDALPGVHGQALAALAELRLAQGRLEEAQRLVSGLEDHPGAVAVIANIQLMQGRAASAESLLRRALGGLDDEERLEVLTLVELLGQALIEQGKPEAALERGRSLADLGSRKDCGVAVARGERLCGRAYAAMSDGERAQAHINLALATFARLGMVLEAARTHLLLAQVLREQSVDAAVDEARTALAELQGLGARWDADAAAALLRELGERTPQVGPREAGHLTRREREVLALLGEGLSNPDIAERLYLSRKTVEHHVARVLAKLGLRSRAEAAAEAVRVLGAAT